MHFQLFIPGATPATIVTALIDVGLSHLTHNVIPKALASGPGNASGVLCSWATNRDEINQGYRPDVQQWIPAIADGELLPAERYWVGLETLSLPTPVQLERAQVNCTGYVDLGDGHQWKIPKADALPCDMLRDDAGETRFVRQAKYIRFCAEAEEWRQLFLGHRIGGQTTYTALRDFVELALQVNYRLIPEVSDALRLFSSGEQGTVLQAALAICRTDGLEVRHGG